ncbi:cation efflux family protein [Pyricularia oryzae]|nr:cation efflux family protein [Pyricularia oryzae]KAI7929318.1 cation efflux family protein [Pyricularia oryzae]
MDSLVRDLGVVAGVVPVLVSTFPSNKFLGGGTFNSGHAHEFATSRNPRNPQTSNIALRKRKIIDENTTENIHVDERQMSPYQDESSHFPMGSIDDIMPGGRNSLILLHRHLTQLVTPLRLKTPLSTDLRPGDVRRRINKNFQTALPKVFDNTSRQSGQNKRGWWAVGSGRVRCRSADH